MRTKKNLKELVFKLKQKSLADVIVLNVLFHDFEEEKKTNKRLRIMLIILSILLRILWKIVKKDLLSFIMKFF